MVCAFEYQPWSWENFGYFPEPGCLGCEYIFFSMLINDLCQRSSTTNTSSSEDLAHHGQQKQSKRTMRQEESNIVRSF
jgi:hypothetical protein